MEEEIIDSTNNQPSVTTYSEQWMTTSTYDIYEVGIPANDDHTDDNDEDPNDDDPPKDDTSNKFEASDEEATNQSMGSPNHDAPPVQKRHLKGRQDYITHKRKECNTMLRDIWSLVSKSKSKEPHVTTNGKLHPLTLHEMIEVDLDHVKKRLTEEDKLHRDMAREEDFC